MTDVLTYLMVCNNFQWCSMVVNGLAHFADRLLTDLYWQIAADRFAEILLIDLLTELLIYMGLKLFSNDGFGAVCWQIADRFAGRLLTDLMTYMGLHLFSMNFNYFQGRCTIADRLVTDVLNTCWHFDDLFRFEAISNGSNDFHWFCRICRRAAYRFAAGLLTNCWQFWWFMWICNHL
jgi:hypothetical protein